MVLVIPAIKFNVHKLPKLIDEFSNSLERIAKNIGGIWRAPRIRRLGADLVSLAFWHEGMREQIEAMTHGKDTPDTREELARKLKESETEVIEAIDRLKRDRNTWIGRQFGTEVAKKLDHIIQLKVGTGYIRDTLAQIVNQPPGHQSVQEAEYLMKQIDEFNDELFALHNDISGRSKSGEPRSKKAQSESSRQRNIKKILTPLQPRQSATKKQSSVRRAKKPPR